MRNNKGQFVKGNIPWHIGTFSGKYQTCPNCHKKFKTYTIKNYKRIYCSRKCHFKNNHPSWKGGRIIRKRTNTSYYMLKVKHHPFADSQDYVREHRLIMERNIKRFLKPKEIVHHINGNGLDNRIENLQLLQSNKEHRILHRKIKAQKSHL